MSAEKVSGLLLGGFIFLIGSILSFSLLDVTPDEMPFLQPFLVVLLLGSVFSFGSGVVVMWLNIDQTYFPNFIIFFFFEIVAVISLFQEGSKWSQLTTIILFSPISLLGGFLVKKYK